MAVRQIIEQTARPGQKAELSSRQIDCPYRSVKYFDRGNQDSCALCFRLWESGEKKNKINKKEVLCGGFFFYYKFR